MVCDLKSLCSKPFEVVQNVSRLTIQLTKKTIHKHQFGAFRNGSSLTNYLFVVSYKSAPVREEFLHFQNRPNIILTYFDYTQRQFMNASRIESDGQAVLKFHREQNIRPSNQQTVCLAICNRQTGYSPYHHRPDVSIHIQQEVEHNPPTFPHTFHIMKPNLITWNTGWVVINEGVNWFLTINQNKDIVRFYNSSVIQIIL